MANSRMKVTQESSVHENLYQESNQGPFTIWLQSLERDKSAKDELSLYKVGKLVWGEFQKVTAIEKENRHKVEVVFSSREEANKLVEDTSLRQENLEAFIPSYRLMRKGVIRNVDTFVTEEEILEYIESPVKVLEVKRINQRNREWTKESNSAEWRPTKSVILTFEGQCLPQEISIYSIKSEVRPYVTSPRFCNKCFKPGHIAKWCISSEKCYRCGRESHREELCAAEKSFCINCQGEHYSNSKQCVVYRKEVEMRRCMAYENISISKARRLVYRTVATQGPIISKENFPTLQDRPKFITYSDKLKSNRINQKGPSERKSPEATNEKINLVSHTVSTYSKEKEQVNPVIETLEQDAVNFLVNQKAKQRSSENIVIDVSEKKNQVSSWSTVGEKNKINSDKEQIQRRKVVEKNGNVIKNSSKIMQRNASTSSTKVSDPAQTIPRDLRSGRLLS